MPGFQDLIGQRFHKLVVLRRVANVATRVVWECQCDCGNVVPVYANHLKRHNTKSCGCLNYVKTLVDVDWDDPVSRNVRRRELYAVKVAHGYTRTRPPEYFVRKLEREKERRKENPEKMHEQDCQKQKRYRDTHPEKVAAHNKKFRENNPEYGAAWSAANPDKMHERDKRRRARKLQAPQNDFTDRQWQEMKAAYGYRCVYCGRKMRRLTQDHITPLSKGGSHTASNIVPACQSCNSKKNTNGPLKPIQPLLILLAPPKPRKKTWSIELYGLNATAPSTLSSTSKGKTPFTGIVGIRYRVT